MPAAGRETIARPRDGLTGAEVTIVPGVADLRLAAAGDVTLLIAGTVDRARGETIAQDYRADGGVGRYTIASQETRGLPFAGRATGGGDRTWDLAVARDLPTALRVDTGVGRTTLDLTGLQLTELDVDTGVGQTVITLPAQGRFSGTVDIGVGELIVRVPGLRRRASASRRGWGTPRSRSATPARATGTSRPGTPPPRIGSSWRSTAASATSSSRRSVARRAAGCAGPSAPCHGPAPSGAPSATVGDRIFARGRRFPIH